MDEFQRRGTTFPLDIEAKNKKQKYFTLLDMGAMHSCMNYSTFCKLNAPLLQHDVPRVVSADGGNLGSMGVAELTLTLGTSKVKQHFIVCRELRRNIILDVDFAKQNCVGIQWTMNRTRILSLKGIKTIEVEEDELRIPVTASYHVRVPPRHNTVFEVNVHDELQGTQVITGNRHLLEKHPNMYQHEIAIKSEKNNETFPLMAITNLDQVKTLHLHKGEVVGFARPESAEVTYIAMTNELNIEETIDVIPRNWIPKQKWNLKSQALNQAQAMFSECSESSRESWTGPRNLSLQMQKDSQNCEKQTGREQLCKIPEHSQDSHQETATNELHISQCNNVSATTESEFPEHSRNLQDRGWCNIVEVVD